MPELVIFVDGVNARLRQKAELTAGMVGAKVRFEFDASWDGLNKIAVFRCGQVQKDALNVQELVVIPAEVLATAGKKLYIGVYGVSSDGALAVPTRWADAGMVFAGADPSGDTTTDPALAVWAQLQAQIGPLEDLETVGKNSVVEAVNEVFAMAEEGISQKKVQESVDKFLAENGVDLTGTVSYASQQNLTEDQQALARGNIVFINGHGHCANQVSHNGFLYITCPNLCNNGEKPGGDEVVYTKQALGTAGETAFTLLSVDSANRKVHAFAYGAGYDREMRF